MTTSNLRPELQAAEPLPAQLLEPNYQNCLRVIGRTLDEHRLDQAVVVEIPEGFTIRAFDSEAGSYVSQTFTNDSLMQTLRVAIYARGGGTSGPFRSPLRPTGYEDFLRALGYQLDYRAANAVVVVECSRYFHVSGLERIGHDRQDTLTPFAEHFEVPGVNRLVNEAAARRTSEIKIGDLGVRNIEPEVPIRIIRPGGSRR